ncbi:MAG: hypothetical protein KIS94_08520 [Chitinophagales bacterium]|nr:hypothetical protein [Chitinophagales bacterium]
MNKFFSLCFVVFSVAVIMAQPSFEGVLTVTYTIGKDAPAVAELRVKDTQVYIKQKQNGNPKYDFFILDTETKDFYTVSTPDKKVMIKYKYDKLTEYYEEKNLKENYRKDYKLAFKQTDKTREENGMKQTRATAEDESLKVTAWTTDIKFPMNEIIPVLRLMNNWNEAQGTTQVILEAEVINKVSKKESTVKVAVRKENVSKDYFKLPKGYTEKDFGRLMEDERNNGKLPAIVQSFAGF